MCILLGTAMRNWPASMRTMTETWTTRCGKPKRLTAGTPLENAGRGHPFPFRDDLRKNRRSCRGPNVLIPRLKLESAVPPQARGDCCRYVECDCREVTTGRIQRSETVILAAR